ncbi:MAG: hypothetical protein F6K10_04790 [Moorea sp. SIO2B7]|nr:hypothetical protein [Moorena sp. SIO2B7]
MSIEFKHHQGTSFGDLMDDKVSLKLINQDQGENQMNRNYSHRQFRFNWPIGAVATGLVGLASFFGYQKGYDQGFNDRSFDTNELNKMGYCIANFAIIENEEKPKQLQIYPLFTEEPHTTKNTKEAILMQHLLVINDVTEDLSHVHAQANGWTSLEALEAKQWDCYIPDSNAN